MKHVCRSRSSLSRACERGEGLCAVWRSASTWSDPERKRKVVDDIGQALGVADVKEWQEVTVKDFIGEGGGGAVAAAGNSLHRLLSDVLPEYKAEERRAQKKERASEYWHSEQRRESFLSAALRDGPAKQIGERMRRQRGGRDFLAMYGGSPLLAVLEIMPERAEKAVADGIRHPPGFWASPAMQRRFLQAAGCLLGVRDEGDWTSVTRKSVGAFGGSGLLAMHSGSMQEVADRVLGVRTEAREDKSEPQDGKEALRKLERELGIEEAWQWRQVSKARMREAGGEAVLGLGDGSVLSAVVACDPEMEERVGPMKRWVEGMDEVVFMEQVAAAFSVREAGDWRKVTKAQVVRMGGKELLKAYGGSLRALLKATVGREWEGDSYDAVKCRPSESAEFWQEEKHVKAFMTHLADVCEVKEMEEWYRVSREDVASVHGGVSLLRAVGLPQALAIAFPHISWDVTALQKATKKSSQRSLALRARQLLGTVDVLEDCRSALGERRLELDVYVQEHRLAFEYQGRHHYEEIACYGPLEVHRERDAATRAACAAAGIRLVVVPYWWDKKLGSLAATVHHQHPELLPSLLTA